MTITIKQPPDIKRSIERSKSIQDAESTRVFCMPKINSIKNSRKGSHLNDENDYESRFWLWADFSTLYHKTTQRKNTTHLKRAILPLKSLECCAYDFRWCGLYKKHFPILELLKRSAGCLMETVVHYLMTSLRISSTF